MRVVAKERCFVDNRIYEAGQIFEYSGSLPESGSGPLEPLEKPAASAVQTQAVLASRPRRGRPKKAAQSVEASSDASS
jgi:hypothetical protein